MRTLSIVVMRSLAALGGCLALLALGLSSCKAPPAVDVPAMSVEVEAPAIRQALHDFVDRTPGAKPLDLDVAQVGVDSGFALVTWMHDKEAGQAVLRKQNETWQVLECEAGWLGLRGVCKKDVPEKVAQRLLDQIDPKWGSYETP